MSSSKKAKAQTFDTGLYGSATTGSRGTTYNPSDFEKNLISMTSSYIPQYINQLANPTYDSNVFKAQTAQRNRLANQSYENNLINPLVSRGLTRGSSLNQMSNQFAQKLADQETDAMATEDTRNATMLSNLFNYYQMPYNNMTNISDYSKNQYAQALANQGSRSSTGAMIGAIAGAGLGSFAGNPAMGAGLGSSVGAMFDK